MNNHHNLGNQDIAVARAVEAIEKDAWLDMFSATPEAYTRISGVSYERLDDAAALADRGVPIAELNRVFGFGLDKPLAVEELDKAISWLGDNAAAGWAIQISPLATPETLYGWLSERGLEQAGSGWAKFYRSSFAPVEATRSSSLEIKLVTRALADDFGHVVQAGFGLPQATAPWFAGLCDRPGWSTYLAFDGTKPVAAGAMFTSGNWAWFGIDATLEEARGRGGQSGLIRRRLLDALENGVVGFTAETSNPPAGQELTYKSYRNYLKMGFGVAYVRQNYKLQPDR